MGFCKSTIAFILCAAISLSSAVASDATSNTREHTTRPAAVAAMFYPGERNTLSATLDRMLSDAKPEPVRNLRALIVPHAGYEYSGPTAANGFKLLAGRAGQTVFVLGPSHYARFEGAAVTPAKVWTTPLGDIPVSPLARDLAARPPFTMTPRAQIVRPAWASRSPRPAPLRGEDTPETWEHSVEVEMPFLQKTMADFSIVPVVCGDLAPQAAARALDPLITDKTFIVVSSDLSHFHPYDQAKTLDASCVNAVLNLDTEAMQRQEACGDTPILILMELAKARGWKTKLIAQCNSGDVTGEKSRVVGYATVAFYESEATTTGTTATPATHAKSQSDLGHRLTSLARASLNAIFAGGNPGTPDHQAILRQSLAGRTADGGVAELEKQLADKSGCFVTLTKNGQLRGCVGHIVPQEPLYMAVIDNARSAALRDVRFRPVRKEELKDIEVEVSVLTPPEPLAFRDPEDLLAKLQPHKDGVVLDIHGASATFLPQVWEQIPDKTDFLRRLSMKAGCEPDAWRSPGVKVQIYHVQAFKESENQ